MNTDLTIDERSLEISWLADGKPISWERLKRIIYEARAIKERSEYSVTEVNPE